MGQKNSILHAIVRKAIKVQTYAHRQNSLPGQDLTLKLRKSSLLTRVNNI